MFLIGVFGIENKDKQIKILDNLNCKKCSCNVSARLIKNFDFFHFFFIPIFKWNERYYVVCEQCNTLYSIKKEKGKAIEQGENINITYWDLEEVNKEYYNEKYFKGKICENCGNKLEGEFKYCPYCGSKIY